MNECSRCGSSEDVRMLTNDWGICKSCRDEIDAMNSMEELDRVRVVAEGTKCEGCGSDISGEHLKPTGFGGYKNPTYSFLCLRCIDRSNAEYNRQGMMGDLCGRDW